MVDPGAYSIGGRITEKTFFLVLISNALWLLWTALAVLWPGRGNRDPVAQDVVRALADDRNGAHLCVLAVPESHVTADKTERVRVWRDALVQGGVKEGDTLLANWR